MISQQYHPSPRAPTGHTDTHHLVHPCDDAGSSQRSEPHHAPFMRLPTSMVTEFGCGSLTMAYVSHYHLSHPTSLTMHVSDIPASSLTLHTRHETDSCVRWTPLRPLCKLLTSAALSSHTGLPYQLHRWPQACHLHYQRQALPYD